MDIMFPLTEWQNRYGVRYIPLSTYINGRSMYIYDDETGLPLKESTASNIKYRNAPEKSFTALFSTDKDIITNYV